MKRKIFLLTLALLSLLLVQTATVALADGAVITSDSSALPVMPEYGANPDLPYYTVVTTQVKSANKYKDVISTVSANETLTEFEVICHYYTKSPQKVMVSFVDGKLTTTRTTNDRTGKSAPTAVQAALDQNIWVPTSECSLPYTDPAPLFSKLTYVVAGVYEEDFVRSNDKLNGLPCLLDDEGLAQCKEPGERQGTVEALTYKTYFYAKDALDGNALSHSTPIEKTAYVYLPYGYSPEEHYNILYLLHGGGDDETKWFTQVDGSDQPDKRGSALNILDNLIASGRSEPCIVVTPGLYYAKVADLVPQTSNAVTENFCYELVDLMRVVEDTYSTYAETVDDAGLIASRDHRALAGLSMGSITTWRSGIAASTDYISWFANMSAGPSQNESLAESYITETIIPALDRAADQGHDIHMMLQFNGTRDQALPPHVSAHKALLNYMNNSDVLRLGDNYDFIVSDGGHVWSAWNLYLFDILQVFFH